MKENPVIVYFSSVTENTKRFIDKLDFESHRIPLRSKDDFLFMDTDFVLFVPTYGGGDLRGTVPKQVVKFLNVEQNRNHCLGVIASGNINFGEAFCIAGDAISKKLNVPYLYRFELAGTNDDVKKVNRGLREFWNRKYNENSN